MRSRRKGKWGANGIRARPAGCSPRGRFLDGLSRARNLATKRVRLDCFASLRCPRNGETALSRDLYVFEIAGLVVDADPRRSDPAREFAGLDDLFHQAADELAVVVRRQPPILVTSPGRLVDEFARRRRLDVFELANLTMETDIRQLDFVGDAGLVDDLVSAIEAALAIGGGVVAQPRIVCVTLRVLST